MYTIRHYKKDFAQPHGGDRRRRAAFARGALRHPRADHAGLRRGARRRPEDAGARRHGADGRARVPHAGRRHPRLRRDHHAAAAERAHERRAAAVVPPGVLQELRPDAARSWRWPSPMPSSCTRGRSTAASRSTRRWSTAAQSVILPQVTFGIAVRMAVMGIVAGQRSMKILISGRPRRSIRHRAATRSAMWRLPSGRIVGHRRGRRRLRRRAHARCQRLHRRARPGRSGGAPARAGLRTRGHARKRNGRGRGRRRHQPGLPARHRPGARRAGPGRDAEVPRREAAAAARCSRSAR